MNLIPVIGLEIHVQLKTKSKMFCACSNQGEYEAPNVTICPVCTGQPGTLPTLNAAALRMGLKAGKALGCRIPDRAKFDRKNYFYPDLPKGYQISQFDLPVAIDGTLEIEVHDKDATRPVAKIGIIRAHLEEDAAKLTHLESGTSTVDYNRAGTPLLEIVTAPDFTSPAEAKAFLTELRAIMRTIGVSDADMEKGHLRCDANISLRRMEDDGTPQDKTLNPKVEVKNLNSFRSVERALEYEIMRQEKLYLSNTPPATDSTRGWNDAKGMTVEQRSKESAKDYRYFPEPDLPALDLTALRDEVVLPELPVAKRARLALEYGLAPADARTLVEDPLAVDFFENAMSELRAWLEALPENEGTREELWDENKTKLAKLASGWFISKLWGLMAETHVTMKNLKIDPENFAEFITLVYTNKVNSTSAQKILASMLELGKDPSQVMEDEGLGQIADTDTLAPIVERIVRENPKMADDYRAGKVQVLKSLLGLMMKATEGRAHPKVTEELLKLHLEH